MKLAPLVAIILAVGVIGNFTKASADEIDEKDLILLLTKHLTELRERINTAETAARATVVSQRTNGLQTTSLVTGSVQGASGLGSGAPGLTPADEWRRLFPSKDKR